MFIDANILNSIIPKVQICLTTNRRYLMLFIVRIYRRFAKHPHNVRDILLITIETHPKYTFYTVSIRFEKDLKYILQKRFSWRTMGCPNAVDKWAVRGLPDDDEGIFQMTQFYCNVNARID